MIKPEQSYKTRAQAYAKFIKAQGLAISERKFYNDCIALNMIQSDKSVLLADLVAYMEAERKSAPTVVRTFADVSMEQRKTEADTRRAEYEADIAGMKSEEIKRKLDRDWIERDKAEVTTAALMILLFNNISYQIQKSSPEMAIRLGLDLSRREEIEIYIEEAISRAFNEISASKLVDMSFADEVDHDDIDQDGV